jgi:hypothetical protein
MPKMPHQTPKLSTYPKGTVLILCPNTGTPVPTGFRMDPASFRTATMSANSFGPCPACGQIHTWDKKDAWVQN